MRKKEISRRERKRELITRELLNGKNWADPMCGPMIIPATRSNGLMGEQGKEKTTSSLPVGK